MTDAIAAYGTLLKLGSARGADSPTFAAISEVKDISGPAYSLDTIDVTSHSSPDGWEELIPAFKRNGEVTFDLNYTPSDATQNIETGLFSVLDDRAVRAFQLIWPDEYGVQFDAMVTGFQPSSPVGDARIASITLKVSGPPTQITPGS